MQKYSIKKFKQYLHKNAHWSEGYKAFHFLLQKPLGYLYFTDDQEKMYRINRRKCCDLCNRSHVQEDVCTRFLKKNAEKLCAEPLNDTPRFLNCAFGRQCCLLPLKHGKHLYGVLYLCNLNPRFKLMLQVISAFAYFVRSIVAGFVQQEEMQAVYESLHPRALAMSTMHTVHRIISSSLDINDLIPRLTRFTLQVVKADYCAIFLLDQRKNYLVKRFESGVGSVTGFFNQKRITVDKGVFGKMVTTGNLYFTKKTVAVPLIEDDVIGIIVVMTEGKGRVFTKVDLEILRTVSEQAVIAIKNAQLFEDHERITTGSVESLSSLLNISSQHEETRYAVLFEKLVFEVGREMKLTMIEQKNMMRAAKLLAIGEIGIPESIRMKKGELTQKEILVIRKHSLKAVEVINSIKSLQPVIPIVLYHHERYDGSGYPHGLKGEEIPLTARIMALIIAFIAMISDRPYRQAKSFEDAVHEITTASGAQFDPTIVEIFIRLINRNDMQKFIRTTINGEVGHGA